MSNPKPRFPSTSPLALNPKGEGGKGGEVLPKAENTRNLLVLNPLQYQKLIKELPPVYVGKDTTDLQAGYQLGIQLVLQKLRDGFVA